MLGGFTGYETAENSERVAVVQRLTWAYLRSVLYPQDNAWALACAAPARRSELGRVERTSVRSTSS